MQKLINDTRVQSVKYNEKIIILKTRYCKDFDCKSYFQNYENKIKIYSREEAFMLPHRDYLEIEDLDDTNGQIILWKSSDSGFEEIKIKV